MPIYYINTGTSPNAGNGDVLRTAFWKANLNFEYLNSISSATFTDITTDIIPAINNTYSLGSPVKQWKELFVSTGSIYLGNVKLSNNNGQLQIQNVVFTYNTVTNEITTETVISGYAAPTVVPNFTVTNTLTVGTMNSPALILNTNSTVVFPLGVSVISDNHDGILIQNDNLNTGITLASQGASATDAWSGLLWSSTPTDVWGGTSTQSWMWVDASGGHISNYYDASLNLLPVTWKFDFNGNIIFPDGTTQDSGIPKALVGPLKRTLPDGARSFNNQNVYPGFTVTVATFLVNGVQPGWYLFGYGLFNTLVESVSTASGYTTISIADTNQMFEPAQRYSISPNLGVEVAIPSTGTGYLYYSGTETDTLIWDNTVLTTDGIQTFRTKTYEGQLVAVTTGVSFTPYDYTHAIFVTEVNNFNEVSVKNISNAGEASADFVCYNDQGDGTTFFIDMGINSSNYNSGDYPIFSPNSAYLYTGGENTSTADLIIGTSTPGSNLKLFSGGIGSESIRFVIHGDTGNVIIGDDANSDDGVNKLQVAGSSTMTGDLRVSGTIYMQGHEVSTGTGGVANTGDITFSGIKIIGADVGSGSGDIELVPDNSTSTYYNSGQYIRIYPTRAVPDAPHIHLAAGSGGDLMLGDDERSVDVNHDNNVYIRTDQYGGAYNWKFDTNGGLVGPTLTTPGWLGWDTVTVPTLRLGTANASPVVITNSATDAVYPGATEIQIRGQRGYGTWDNNSQSGGVGTNLYFWAGAGGESSTADAGGEGGNIYLHGGMGQGGGWGGDIEIEAGPAAYTNNFYNSSTNPVEGGHVNIISGDAISDITAGTGTGGQIKLRAGRGNTANGEIQFETSSNSSTWETIWKFKNDGSTTFPTLTVPISDNVNPSGTGQTIKFSDPSQQAIIYGPPANASYTSAERIILQGAPGYAGTNGEGGDIYLWAGAGGDMDGGGGDIKIRSGRGYGVSNGGYLNFQAGNAVNTGYGGWINIESGTSGSTGQGGNISVIANNGGQIQFQTYNLGYYNWTFKPNGATEIPGTINSTVGIGDVVINASGATTSTWTFTGDGRTIFPALTAPTHSYGAAGDTDGMVAFDNDYIYYCTANYVNTSTDIWKRVALDATPW